MSTLLADSFTFAIYSWSYETWFGIQTLDGFPFMFNRAITHTWAIGPHGWVGGIFDRYFSANIAALRLA